MLPKNTYTAIYQSEILPVVLSGSVSYTEARPQAGGVHNSVLRNISAPKRNNSMLKKSTHCSISCFVLNKYLGALIKVDEIGMA
jgi:hypothetical protein